jgi:CPA1 family monovalent cation:H+ antiporter
VLLQFIGTFAVWLLAERVGLSPIITMVSYAMTLARRAPARMDGRRRIVSYAVWEVAVFVLNVLAFLLIGLQLSSILDRTQGADLGTYLMNALAVCATVVIVRPLWWMPWNAFVRWRIRRQGARLPRPTMLPSAGSGLVISWAGMRGIVTLAAAIALPPGMPHRDFILLAAFAVVLSTLVLQGLTLGPLMNRVCLHPDDSVDREVSLARVETSRAALRALEDADDDGAAEILRAEYAARIQSGKRASEANAGTQETSSLARLQSVAVAAQRRELFELRERGVIGDDAFHAIEEEIDVLELTADARIRPDVIRGEFRTDPPETRPRQ